MERAVAALSVSARTNGAGQTGNPLSPGPPALDGVVVLDLGQVYEGMALRAVTRRVEPVATISSMTRDDSPGAPRVQDHDRTSVMIP